MKLVDSSGWLEFYTGGPLAGAYAHHLADLSQVITPTVVLHEVYRKIKRERSEDDALQDHVQVEDQALARNPTYLATQRIAVVTVPSIRRMTLLDSAMQMSYARRRRRAWAAFSRT